MDHTEESYEAAGDPSLDVISAYQRRVRRLRSLLLAETIVFLPLVIILATILILGRVERGQMAVIRFGTALELAVADEGTAVTGAGAVQERLEWLPSAHPEY